MSRITKENLDIHLTVSRLLGEIHSIGYLIRNHLEMPLNVHSTLHVDWLEISIARNKEEFLEYHSSMINDTIRLNFTEEYGPEPKELIKTLIKVKRNMEKILKENGLDYKGLDYNVRTHEYKQYLLSV